jgi:hypothetical protein
MSKLLDEIIRDRKPNNSGNDFLRYADTITVAKQIPKDASGNRFELKEWMIEPINETEFDAMVTSLDSDLQAIMNGHSDDDGQ